MQYYVTQMKSVKTTTFLISVFWIIQIKYGEEFYSKDKNRKNNRDGIDEV